MRSLEHSYFKERLSESSKVCIVSGEDVLHHGFFIRVFSFPSHNARFRLMVLRGYRGVFKGGWHMEYHFKGKEIGQGENGEIGPITTEAKTDLRDPVEGMEMQKLALDGAGVATWDWNIITGEVRRNRAWAEILGFHHEEIRPHISAWEELIHPEDSSMVKSTLDQHLLGNTPHFQCEYRLRSKSGNWVWVLEKGRVVLRDKEGRPLRMCGTFMEINRLKEAELKAKGIAQLYLDTAGDIIVSLDAEGKILVLNESGHRILGYAPGELIGKDWFGTCLPPSIREEVRGEFLRLMREGSDTIEHFVNPVLTKAGEERQIYWRNQVLKDKDGTPMGTISSGQDITELKKKEEALKNNLAIFQELSNLAPVGIVLHDGNRFIYVNKKMEEITGYSKDELLSNMTPFDIFHQDYRELICKRAEDRLLGHDVEQSYEAKLVCKDNTQRWIQLYSSTVIIDRKRLVVAIIMDVTEKKLAELGLRKSELKYKLLVESVNDVICVVQDGVIKYVNPQVTNITGYSIDELIDRSIFEFIYPEDRKIVYENYTKRLSGEPAPPVYEFRILDRYGNIRWIRINTSWFEWEGRPANLYVATDITEALKKEREIREIQERYAEIFEGSRDGLVIVGIDERIIGANKAYCEMLGYTLEELKGKKIYDCMPEKWHQRERMEIVQGRLLQQGYSGLYESEYLAKGGRSFPVELQAYVSRDERGQIKYLWWVARDIEERKMSREALKKSEEKYRRIFENTVVGFFQSIPEGRFLLVNPAFARIFGYESPQELIDSTYDIAKQFYKNPEDRMRFLQILEENGYVENFEVEMLRKDGSSIWVSNSTRAYFDESKNLKYYEGITMDITAKKKFERTLYEERQQLISIFDSIDHIINTIDPDTYEIIYVNKATKRLFAHDIIGKKCYKVFHGKKEPCEFCPIPIVIQRNSEPYTWISTNIITGRTYLCTDRMINWTDHRPVKFQYAVDITDIKKAEEEKAKLQEQLFQAQRLESVGRLAGGVAHDYNNMLNVILGNTDLALRKVSKEHPVYKHLERVREAAERSINITRQLLAFARKQSISPKVLDLNETLESMLKMLRRLIGEDIELHWSPAPKLAKVYMDPGQIDQILVNLVINAKDAIREKGRITISTKELDLDQVFCEKNSWASPGSYVMVNVSDNGMGISPEHMDKIFEPFFTTKEAGKGTGLGLATVYGIVKQNNGLIRVESKVGEGTSFEIYIPAYKESKEEESEEFREGEGPVGGGEAILIVEDEPSVLRVIEEMIQELGYKPIATSSPKDALGLVARHGNEIRLALLDFTMPEINGPALAKEIQKEHPDIKIIIMSGYSGNWSHEHGVEGAYFMEKPFNTNTLGERIKALLGTGVPNKIEGM